MNKKILLVFLGIILFSTITNAGKVQYNFKTVCWSNSMYPTFDCNKMLKATTITSSDKVEINHIYCYRPNYNNFNLPLLYNVCHRLINIEDNLYYFKGDNNADSDPPIERRYIAWEIVNY